MLKPQPSLFYQLNERPDPRGTHRPFQGIP